MFPPSKNPWESMALLIKDRQELEIASKGRDSGVRAVFSDATPLFGLPFRNYVQSTYSELYLEASSPTTLSRTFGRRRESIFDGSSLGSSMLRALF